VLLEKPPIAQLDEITKQNKRCKDYVERTGEIGGRI
jgi:hypothetical protein